MFGTLFIVATPIGNLEDITLRALRVLKEVDAVFAEDTRVAGKLLFHYEIKKPLKSYNAHASDARHNEIIALLEDGKNVALVSDAGTPGISDPGTLLVSEVRNALADVKIVAIPGPSAVTAALSASGISSSEFVFLGFLPHKKGRETLFKEIAVSDRTMVFYESVHRFKKTLASLKEHCGPDRIIVVSRELTKVFEENRRGTVGEIQAHYESHPDTIRGEFVVIVSPRS